MAVKTCLTINDKPKAAAAAAIYIQTIISHGHMQGTQIIDLYSKILFFKSKISFLSPPYFSPPKKNLSFIIYVISNKQIPVPLTRVTGEVLYYIIILEAYILEGRNFFSSLDLLFN